MPTVPAKDARPVVETGRALDIHGATVSFGADHDAVYIDDADGRHLFDAAQFNRVVLALSKAFNIATTYERNIDR